MSGLKNVFLWGYALLNLALPTYAVIDLFGRREALDYVASWEWTLLQWAFLLWIFNLLMQIIFVGHLPQRTQDVLRLFVPGMFLVGVTLVWGHDWHDLAFELGAYYAVSLVLAFSLLLFLLPVWDSISLKAFFRDKGLIATYLFLLAMQSIFWVPGIAIVTVFSKVFYHEVLAMHYGYFYWDNWSWWFGAILVGIGVATNTWEFLRVMKKEAID